MVRRRNFVIGATLWPAGLALSAPSSAMLAARPRVDLALVLLVDGSASIRDQMAMQIDGHMAACRDPAVVQAIQSQPSGAIAVTVLRYAGPEGVQSLVPWRRVAGPEDADRLAARLNSASRTPGEGSTALGTALRGAAEAFSASGFEARRQVVDLIANGFNNAGPPPETVRPALARAGITVNALAILNDYGWLERYLMDSVVTGAEGFVTAVGHPEDFVSVLRAKLIREIA